MYQSPEAFRAHPQPLLALEFTDIGLYYRFIPEQEAVYERVATEILRT